MTPTHREGRVDFSVVAKAEVLTMVDFNLLKVLQLFVIQRIVIL